MSISDHNQIGNEVETNSSKPTSGAPAIILDTSIISSTINYPVGDSPAITKYF